jgi:hypothetical protein
MNFGRPKRVGVELAHEITESSKTALRTVEITEMRRAEHRWQNRESLSYAQVPENLQLLTRSQALMLLLAGYRGSATDYGFSYTV